MRNVGKSGMIAGLFALVLAVAGAAALVSYAVAGGGPKKEVDGGRGLVSPGLGF